MGKGIKMKKKLICFIGVLIAAIIIFLGVSIYRDIREEITDIKKYEKVLGEKGKYKENLVGCNDIFPNSLENAENVEAFHYLYYNPWDPNYFGYLVCTYSEKQFEEEVSRLKSLDSTEYEGIYGIEKFPYELCAVYADSYYGVIYAVADSTKYRIAYVSLEFCNYFTDIKYEQRMDKDYLPTGFNANPGNETRKAFEQGAK